MPPATTPLEHLQAMLQPLLERSPELRGELDRFCSAFAFVPRADYEAQVEHLRQLNEKIAELETRLEALD